MLGANRLALEAWPFFPCFPNGAKLATRGILGSGMFDTYWTWPLWSRPLTREAIGSLLSLEELQQRSKPIDTPAVRARGVSVVFRSQRILVGKTPNLTAAQALA
jgi:CRISPR-associated endonuclease/helicase Cas3